MVMKCISIAACLFVAACGGGQDQGTDAEPEPTAYEEMTFDQRRALMKEVVLPEMKEMFAAFDPRFERMRCGTCHGDGATDRAFAMPNPQLPRLPATEEAFLQYVNDPDHGRWSQFMKEKVWPQMARILEVPTFDQATSPNGFSCHNCHMVEGERL
jgi:hypothetical protein